MRNERGLIVSGVEVGDCQVCELQKALEHAFAVRPMSVLGLLVPQSGAKTLCLAKPVDPAEHAQPAAASSP